MQSDDLFWVLVIAFAVAPVITGPVAFLVFMRLWKRGRGKWTLPFWSIVITLNLTIVAGTIADAWFLPHTSLLVGPMSCLSSYATLVIMTHYWRRLAGEGWKSSTQKAYFLISGLLIAGMLIGLYLLLLLLSPVLCERGLLPPSSELLPVVLSLV